MLLSSLIRKRSWLDSDGTLYRVYFRKSDKGGGGGSELHVQEILGGNMKTCGCMRNVRLTYPPPPPKRNPAVARTAAYS